MITYNFYLQIVTANGKSSHSVGQDEESLEKIPAKADWQRYKLTIEDGKIVSLEQQDRFFHASHVCSLATHKPQLVPLHKSSVMLGASWQHISTSDPALQGLMRLMGQVLQAPVSE